MSKELQKFLEWVKENQAQQPSLGAEIRAMGREAIKDLRGTIHEAMWGRPEHMPEIGTPLNPTQKNYHGRPERCEQERHGPGIVTTERCSKGVCCG